MATELYFKKYLKCILVCQSWQNCQFRGKVVCVHAMDAQRVSGGIPSFLISVLDVAEW